MKAKLFLATLLLSCTSVMAQENFFGGPALQSPVINPDNTVTFNLKAPKAVTVKLVGNFLPKVKMQTRFGEMEVAAPVDMKEVDGTWTYTTSALEPDIYTYNFEVDGQKALDPNNVRQMRDGSAYQNNFIIKSTDTESKGYLYDHHADVAHGTVSRVWYDSPTLGITRRMTVYTPAGYEGGKQKYPVFYLLHGAGGDEEAWADLGREAQILDNLIALGKAKPMIVVMTNGNPTQTASQNYLFEGMEKHEGPAERPQAKASMDESFTDVVNFIEQHYRVIKKKESRAIAGLSMGGGHTFAISKRYPDMFDYIGLYSPAIFVGNRQDPNAPAVDEKVAQELKVLFSKNPKLYFMAIGNTDFLYKSDMEIKKNYFETPGYPLQYLETEGGHTWANWRHYLTVFVPQLFK